MEGCCSLFTWRGRGYCSQNERNKLNRQGIHYILIIRLLCFAETISKYHISTKATITSSMMELMVKQNERN